MLTKSVTAAEVSAEGAIVLSPVVVVDGLVWFMPLISAFCEGVSEIWICVACCIVGPPVDTNWFSGPTEMPNMFVPVVRFPFMSWLRPSTVKDVPLKDMSDS